MTDDQPDLFPDIIQLSRIDPEKNMLRFYRLTVQRDLFGGAMLTREFGRIGSPGRVLSEIHADEGIAVNSLADWVRKKRKGGYITR